MRTCETPGSMEDGRVMVRGPRKQRRSIDTGLLLAVYAPAGLLAFGQGVLVATLPLYAGTFGVSYTLVSLAVGAAALGTLATDVPAGALVGRLGLRQTMTVGTALVAASTLALAVIEHFPLLIAARLVAGIGTAMWGLSRHAFIATAVPIGERGRAISVFGGINRIGTFAGPAVGGALAAWISYQASFIAAGLLATLALVLAIRFIPASSAQPAAGSAWGRWRVVAIVLRQNRRDLAAAAVAQTLAQMIRAGRLFLVPVFGADVLGLTAAQVGLIMTISAVIDVSMFVPAGQLMDRFGRKTAAVPSFAVMAAGVALIPLAESFGGLLLATAVIGFGNGLGSGTMMTLGADLAPEGAIGEFLGLWRLIGDAGAFLGPVAVGIIAGAAGLHGSALVLAGVGIAASATLALLVRETRQMAPA
ncbi:MAG: MFS transporter [Chloroflexota bacterium]